MKKRPQDYFTGEITQGGVKVAEVNGTYMGYMEVNGIRLWDARECDSYHHEIRHVGEACLPSDSTLRLDSITLS